jgi:hypothetical protein
MTPAASGVGSAAPASPAERLAIEQERFADLLLPAQLPPRLSGRVLRARSTLATARDVIPSAFDREAEMLVGERQIEAAVTEVIA